ncbi:isochorismatase family protein [Picrophilus oshimae]|uniref:Nicotinamidase-related amidase n=1 Tax=Picrophilus torridus (strain ATCC 700027 / DSM 9790 / JCM 10055 / NBRC 100828 / KAW 2/3) TaxID=1122961 RepID=A0A8G2FVQ4_PICTO|nr:isochorismatase family protein [Picrophilus oshimae]SMD30348.1 Nicotinamidase-related amidase [Picrophilus oshimae DSM 9789]
MKGIIVIDPQKGFENPGTLKTFYRIFDILRNGYSKYLKVYIFLFLNDEKSPFRRNMEWWNAFHGSPDTDVIQNIDINGYKTYYHNRYSIINDDFLNEIEKYNINEFLITGVETDASVLLAAMELFDLGIHVLICPDLVYSIYGDKGQDAGLFIIRKVLGDSGFIGYGDVFKWLYEK